MYQVKSNKNSIDVEIIVAIVVLMIYIILSWRETATTQLEINIQSARIPNRKNKDTNDIADRSRISLDELLLHKIYNLLEQNELNKKVINQILGFVGDYYEINRACIIEFSERSGQILNHFSWHKKGFGADPSNYYDLSVEGWSKYLNCFDKEGVFCCSASTLREQDAKQRCCNCDAVSSLQCSVVGGEQFKVLIVLEDCQQDRVWTKDQKDTLNFITKILGYYLMHLQTQQTLIEVASVDILTGVRSFEAFHTEAKELIRINNDKKYALIISDIQRFKDINDLIGHNKGDKVIIYFASSIQNNLKPCELIGRVSADVFTILLEYEDSDALTTRMMDCYSSFQTCIQPLNIINEIYVAAGIYLIQPGENDIPSIFDKANAARKISKDTRKNSTCYYDDELHQKLMFEKEVEDCMLSSLENDDFLVYVQPKYTLLNRKISGGEALVRWKHPSRGFILPCDFIPLFEKNLFILDLDFYVLDKVCGMIHDWKIIGKPIVPISVNFSRVHLTTPDFVSKLVKTIQKYNVPSELLEIELTESAFIHGDTNILKVTEELKKQGFTISMDDFGSGYSSLNTLKDLPIDVLKLDKGFFKNDIPTDKEKIIIEGFVNMAKKLHMKVVSEGVEYEWQAQFLNSIECDLAQGYLFSHPVSIDEFENMLHKQTYYQNVQVQISSS